MITIQELHIAFREGLNQIASYQGDEYLEDEIDRYLTRAQVAVVTQLNKEYTQSTNYAKELATLETINKRLPVYYPRTAEIIYANHSGYNFGYIIPPTDYMYAINIKPNVISGKLCDTNYVETNTEISEYIAIVPFNTQLINNNNNNNLDFILTNNNVEILSLTGYNLPSIQDENDKFYFINVILEEINRRNQSISNTLLVNNPINKYTLGDVTVYWEKYRSYYYPNSFIFVSNTNYTTTPTYIEVKIDSTTVTTYTSNNSITDYIIAEEKARGLWYKTIYISKNATGASYTELVIAREVDKKKAMELLDNPLDKPTRYRPHSVHSGNYIWVHTPKRTITDYVLLDYIRYPKPVSLRLQWHCELDKLLLQDVVNKAVQMAMMETGDNKVQGKVAIDKYDE